MTSSTVTRTPERDAPPFAHQRLACRASIASCLLALAACGPLVPEPGGANGTTVTVTHGEPPSESDKPPSFTVTTSVGPMPAAALDPPAKAIIGASTPLIGGVATEGPLPLPTTIAATRSALFVFGRTRAGYVVRAKSMKYQDRDAGYGAPVVVAAAFDDDAPPIVIGDADGAWLAVSNDSGIGVRISRIDLQAGPPPGSVKVTHVAPAEDGTAGAPAKLGRVAALVPMASNVAVIGVDGTSITMARLARTATFLDATAKTIAQGSLRKAGTRSRSPRATREDDKVLLAWDADDVTGALESPGTTPEERAAPKPGIYVRRFDASGDPSSPARRLTRPSFEAHTLDVVVELGACAVLASTDDGYEMFRFVRKGNDLSPYGGGLHLAGSEALDVSLGADAFGTLAVTTGKLLRIGPGVKIVPSALGFSAPTGGTFDEVHLAMDGSGAYTVIGARTALGELPTIAKIDSEKMGAPFAAPWIGPPPQRLLLAALLGDEGLALVIDAGALHAVRLDASGAPKSSTVLPFDLTHEADLTWARAPVPRVARAGGEWLVAMRDGRVLIATGAQAGKIVAVGAPSGAAIGGMIAITSDAGKKGLSRLFWIPPAERSALLSTATIDPAQGAIVDAWAAVASSEHHYGVLGGARYVALSRAQGGMVLLANSGPKVSSAAQLYDLVTVGPDGAVASTGTDAPGPVDGISLAPSATGPVLVANVTGTGPAARWLDAQGAAAGWKTSFAYLPFRTRGDGPVLREKGGALTLGGSALPFDLGPDVASMMGERCAWVLSASPRSLLLGCEEGSGATPLAARATTRLVNF